MRDFLAEYNTALGQCPGAGGGVHAWVMGTANLAVFAGVDGATAEHDICAAMSRPENPRGEVAAAIRKAINEHADWRPNAGKEAVWQIYGGGVQPSGTAPAVRGSAATPNDPDAPEVAQSLIEEAGDGGTPPDWWEDSPIRPGESRDDAALLLRSLFRADEWVFVGDKYDTAIFKAGELAAKIEAGKILPGPHIIPNPLDGEEHETGGGKKSKRCDAAVADFRFAVAEMDQMPLDDQLRLWWAWRTSPELSAIPIQCLVYSGGKSVHAWLRVDAKNREEFDELVKNQLFAKVLVPLGCDKTCKNPSRLSRMAGHQRKDKDGNWQQIHFLNSLEATTPTAPLGERVGRCVRWLASRRESLARKGGDSGPEDAQAASGEPEGEQSTGDSLGPLGDAVATAKGSGKKGRPPIALEVANAYCIYLGEPLPLRYWNGSWYRHIKGRYRAITDSTAFCEVMGYLHRHWPKNATPSMVKTVLAHCMADDTCAVPPDYKMPCWFPDGKPAPEWRAMENGVLDIEAAARGELSLKPFDPKLFSLMGSDFAYDASATCPRWDQALLEWLPDEDSRLMLQMMFGLCLVPDTSHDVIFILVGPGGTGKTVVAEVLESILGEENVAHLDIVDLDEKHGQHLLAETLVNVTSEIPARLNSLDLSNAEAQIKRAASGEKVKCERKNKDPYFSTAIARLVFCVNTLPMFTDTSGGLWRRVRLIPFDRVQVGQKHCDPHLKEKLFAERPGIFNWALRGLHMLRTGYPYFPQLGRGTQIIAEHRLACDKERTFLEQRCEIFPGHTVSSADLYTSYKGWCDSNGYKPKGANTFAQDVRRVFPGVSTQQGTTHNDRRRYWVNIRLRILEEDEIEI